MPDAFGFPVCMFCGDTGLTFDYLNGYRWCTCVEGAKRLAAEPGLVDESNRQRTVLGIGGRK